MCNDNNPLQPKQEPPEILMTTLSSLSLSFFDGYSLTAKGNKAFFMTHYSLQEQGRKRSFLKLKPNLMSKYLLQKLL